MNNDPVPPIPVDSSGTPSKAASRVANLVIGGLLVAFVFMMGQATWNIRAICPKCLQQAGIYKKTLFGLTIYKWTSLSQSGGGITSLDQASPRAPRIHPGMYEQIKGRKCAHEFLWGGFGSSGAAHVDGAFRDWSLGQPYMDAMAALYRAFATTGDREAAVAVLAMIEDAGYPLDDTLSKEKAYRALEGYRRLPKALDGGKEAMDLLASVEAPEVIATIHKMEKLQRITVQLEGIETKAAFLEAARTLAKDPGSQPLIPSEPAAPSRQNAAARP